MCIRDRTYLKNAGLCVSPKRGIAQVTERGRAVLAKRPQRIDVHFLEQFAEFLEFRARRRDDDNEREPDAQPARTPLEELEAAYGRIRAQLEDELLERVRAMSATDFEQLVVDLLVRMGYGGSHADAARAVGRSGDGGIDGIIKEDRLGLDTVSYTH